MTAYYNEIDPYAAAWLRNLIAEGHIAPGDVDERDIRDVSPADLRDYAQCHFFAGIGVWSHSLRRAGWEDDRPVWTGSCPCQPFSAAGGRAGFDDERHLWPHWHWLIEQCRPQIVFGEQVASKDGLGWLDLVSADLQGAGYAFEGVDLCGAGFGAPHIRQRLWFVGVADAIDNGFGEHGRCLDRASRQSEGEPRERQRFRVDLADGRTSDRVAQPSSQRRLGRRAGEARPEPGAVERPERLRDAVGLDHHHHQRSQGHAGHDGAAGGRQEPGRSAAEASLSGGLAEHDCAGLQRGQRHDQTSRYRDSTAPAGVDDRHRQPSPTDGFWRAADWLFCRDGKWRPVEPGTFPLVDGSSFRLDSGSAFAGKSRVGMLRAAGNAIIAEVAVEFITAVRLGLAEDLA